MQFILNALDKGLMTPIKSIKKRYIPLLCIYFAFGAQGIATIALTFWEKTELTLSTEQFLVISAWVSFPWTMKMIFGQLVDVFPLFGSRRKSYIYLGASLVATQFLLLYGLAIKWGPMMALGNQFQWYLLAALIGVVGFVIQDVTADTMSTEVVDRTQRPKALQKEITLVQILGRLSLMIAIAVVSGLGGFLASALPYEQVFLIALVVPVISILGALFVNLDIQIPENIKFDPFVLGGGLAFAVFSILMAFNQVPYSQEIVFGVSLTLLGFLLWHLIKDQSKSEQKLIIFALLTIFLFRATPSVGPGLSWWSIDVLGFNEAFFGVLKQIGALTALAVLWFSSDFIASKSIRWVLLFLIATEFIISLPELGLYYGVHDMIGVSAHTIALFDTALESPLVHISMIPMLALIAFYAPAGKRGTWFAVAGSFMNLALTAGTLGTKYLNKIFIVNREILDDAGQIITAQDYSQLGWLLLIVITVSTLMPLIAVLCLLNKKVLGQKSGNLV